MRSQQTLLLLILGCGFSAGRAYAQTASNEPCARAAAGAGIAEPYDLRSQNGELSVELSFRKSSDRPV